jgi:hypothetical protein
MQRTHLTKFSTFSSKKKTLNKLSIVKKNYLNIIKVIYENFIANIIFNESFSIHNGIKKSKILKELAKEAKGKTTEHC